MDNGKVVLCSRDIAVIYYLTKKWSREDGGLLKDLAGGTDFVPQFNSLIAFRIPRMHQVCYVYFLYYI
jgi:Rps23 Pro-64 3,4-dihydroxylase Tpa1-like proline 4-hydroxylase